MRTYKRRLPIQSCCSTSRSERRQIVMEPEKNARNIPATVIGCQGKNVCRFKKKRTAKKGLRRASLTVYDAPAQMG
jgi:hypothetical protein